MQSNPFQPLLDDIQNLIRVDEEIIPSDEVLRREQFTYSIDYLNYPIPSVYPCIDMHLTKDRDRTKKQSTICDCKYGHIMNDEPYDIVVPLVDDNFLLGLRENGLLTIYHFIIL